MHILIINLTQEQVDMFVALAGLKVIRTGHNIDNYAEVVVMELDPTFDTEGTY